MRLILLIISISVAGLLQAQEASFNISRQDTIELNRLHFKKTVALKLEGAVVLLDYQPLIRKLKNEKGLLEKEIKARKRMIKKRKDYLGVTSYQLKLLQQRLSVTNSICTALASQKSDTAWIAYSVIDNDHSSVSNLVSSCLETNQCMILNPDHELQTYIVKQTGSIKTGEMTGVGLTYYFIKGTKRQFWTKMNWIS